MIARASSFHKRISALIVSFATLLCGFVLCQTASDLRTYSVGDLETRIAGARRLMNHLNPYQSTTIPSPEYFNPRQSTATLLPEYYRASGPTTPSPAHLLLYAPLRNLSFGTQQRIYFVIDWIIVLGCFLALARVVDDRTPHAALLFLFSVLLVFDATFRLHLAAGQLTSHSFYSARSPQSASGDVNQDGYLHWLLPFFYYSARRI